MAGEEDGVGPGGSDLAEQAAQRLDGVEHLEAGEVFRRQPGGERRSGGADDGEADAGDFLDEPWADLGERAGGEAERLALDAGVAGEDGHFRCADAGGEGVRAPIELVVADDPGVVVEGVEAADHGGAAGAQADLGAPGRRRRCRGERVGVVAAPLADLRGAAGEAAEVAVAGVVGGGEDVAVEIVVWRMEMVTVLASAAPERRGERGGEGPLPEQAQEAAAGGRGREEIHGAIMSRARAEGTLFRVPQNKK